jgi:hypothetical protein
VVEANNCLLNDFFFFLKKKLPQIQGEEEIGHQRFFFFSFCGINKKRRFQKDIT